MAEKAWCLQNTRQTVSTIPEEKRESLPVNPSTTSISIATPYLQVLLQQVKTVLIVPKPESIMENLISGMLLITIYKGTCQFHDTLRQSYGQS